MPFFHFLPKEVGYSSRSGRYEKKTDGSCLPEVKETQKCKLEDNQWHNSVLVLPSSQQVT